MRQVSLVPLPVLSTATLDVQFLFIEIDTHYTEQMLQSYYYS
ncbi:MAG: hypothetical protein NVS4B12_27910 [Ktedonobacteraceae bacterium]